MLESLLVPPLSHEWKAAEELPLQRSVHPFTISPGPSDAVSQLRTPEEIFNFMLDSDTVKGIVEETNRYD